MKNFFRYIIIPITMFIIGFMAYRVYKQININATDDNIQYIREHMNSAGTLVDYNGNIGVKSIKDVKLYVTKKEVRIEYGKIQLTWNPDDFLDKKYDIPLEQIGITRRISPKTNKLEVFYQGVLLERWSS